MGNLVGNVVIVTGAVQGMGAAQATLLAGRAARVVLTDVSDAAGEAIAAQYHAADHVVDYFHLDVSNEASWQQVLTLVSALAGRVDTLVNSAGLYVRAAV
jgi:NAD(P)-dependent dehydrogenase (short-subunit alcohol dehydrogenase family)